MTIESHDARLERMGRAYRHYCERSGWVGGPVVSRSEREIIRAQVAKHGRGLSGRDAAENMIGRGPDFVAW